MGVERLSESVYSVGVMNPSLRIFDIVMKSEYGTSYNSYLITGKKNVLVETVHNDFFEEYFRNVQSLVDIDRIDYIVMNHTEPDHSGSLRKILDINPKIKVVCSVPGQKYLSQITNRDFEYICVKDGDKLDIGGRELEFIIAPMLHWPDSMMTWFDDEKMLFSCDFLGAHFCEPAVFDTNIDTYKEQYLAEFKNYYNGIFGPFKPHVLSGIDKMKKFEAETICPSHGPVLTETIKDRVSDYYNWSREEGKKDKIIEILYASCYGFTKKLAEASADAINRINGVKSELIDIVTTPLDEITLKIAKSIGILIGSCTINRDAPKIIWDVLSRVDAINSRGKIAGCFGSFGWSGEAVGMIEDRLRGLGFKVKENSVKVRFNPSEDDIKNMKNYAEEFASMIK